MHFSRHQVDRVEVNHIHLEFVPGCAESSRFIHNSNLHNSGIEDKR